MKKSSIVEEIRINGCGSLSDEQLLDILIGDGAHEVLEELPLNNIYYLGESNVNELCKAYNVGHVKAAKLLSAVELGKRISKRKVKMQAPDFSTPEAVADYVMEDMRHLPQEEFRAVYLTTKNQLIAVKTLTIGTINASLAKSREVFRYALQYNASAAILVHNHPSGNPEPSREDIVATKSIADAGTVMDIPILDHVIIGDGTYVSLCERGYI